MNKLGFFILLASVSLIFNACRKITGEGPVVSENRAISNFTALSMRISGDVNYRQDNVYRVEIRAQENIINYIETPIINGELVLRFKNNVYVRSHDDIVINVSAPALTSLSVSGSGNLHTFGDYKPASLRLEISGSGNMNLQNLTTNDLEASISGSGDIQASSGTATQETLKISGSGSINLVNVSAKSATSTTSGSGTTRVNLTESLNAKISGSGNVYYKGTPSVTASISGSGKIMPL